MNDKLSFEQAMERLEQIVRTMERGDAKLEESLKLFQEGTKLVRHCAKTLEQAEMQVKQVMISADGSPILEEFTDAQDA